MASKRENCTVWLGRSLRRPPQRKKLVREVEEIRERRAAEAEAEAATEQDAAAEVEAAAAGAASGFSGEIS